MKRACILLVLLCLAAAPPGLERGDEAFAQHDVTTALTAWTDALVEARASGDVAAQFQLELRLAAAHRRADNLETAATLLQHADEHASTPLDQRQLALAEALHWQHVGAYSVAEAHALRAFHLAQAEGDVGLATTVAYTLGVIRRQRGDVSGSQEALTGALKLAQATGNTVDEQNATVALAQLALSEADVATALSLARPFLTTTGSAAADAHAVVARAAELTGDTTAAVDHYNTALAHARDTRDVRRQAEWLSRLASLHVRRGEVELARDQWDAAEAALIAWEHPTQARSVAIDRATALGDGTRLAELHGDAIAAEDARAEARTGVWLAEHRNDVQLATRALELANELGLMQVGWQASRFLGQWWMRQGQPERAVPYLEEARSRVAVLRTLQSASPADVDATQTSLAQALLESGDAAGAVGVILRPPTVDAATVAQLTEPTTGDRHALAQMRVAFSDRVDRMRASNPELEQVTRIAPEELEALQADLPPGTLIVSPIALDDRLVLLTLSRSAVDVTEVPVTRADVQRRISRLMRALRAGLVDDDGWAIGQGDRLGEWLIEPIIAQLDPIDTVVFVGGGPFRQLPTALIRHNDQWLTDSVAIAHVTHAASLASSSSNPVVGHALLIGNPDGTLPGAEAEVHAIADLLPGSRTLTGIDASLDAVRSGSEGAGVVHFATHGRIDPGVPERSHLVLGDTPLMYGQIPGLAPWLHDTELVVLSACESGLPVQTSGTDDDGKLLISIDGLAAQFRRAGVDTLVASLWKVDDDATRALMQAFYSALAAGQPVHQALATAQATVRAEPRWAHPAYWAAFSVIGDWRAHIEQ